MFFVKLFNKIVVFSKPVLHELNKNSVLNSTALLLYGGKLTSETTPKIT